MTLRYRSIDEIPSHLRPDQPPAASRKLTPIAPAVLRKSKYGNRKVELDGHVFDSAFQARRYKELRNMQMAGLITDLRLEPVYGLHVNGKRIGSIEPDFDYRRAGELVVEDTKTKVTKTPLYEWKRAHLLAEYGIAIVEIERTKRPRVGRARPAGD